MLACVKLRFLAGTIFKKHGFGGRFAHHGIVQGENMDWYLIAKFLHLTSAIIWLGGAMIMVFLGIRADRAKDDADMVAIVLKVAFLGGRVYVPAGLLTLIFGAITVWLGHSWTELWIIIGLIGFVITFTLGATVLKPRADRVEADHKASGASASVILQSREILQIAKFDMTLLFSIVLDMVLKPTATDYWVLAIIAVVIVVAALAFLVPLRSGGKAAAA